MAKKVTRVRKAARNKRRLQLESLESRLLFAASPTVEPRDFPFTLSGNYTGSNPGTYISLPSNTVKPYLDQFSGQINGSGTAHYTDNQIGSAAIQLSNSPGSGKDTFWEHYEYDYVGTLGVSDSGGQLSGGGGKRVLDWDSVELYDPPTLGYGIKATNLNRLPETMTGTWSPDSYSVSLQGSGPFSFVGTVTPTTTGPTDINVTHVLAACDCVEIEAVVTGTFPRAAHTTEIGFVKAEWLNASGGVVQVLFDEPVYWNTGRVSLDEPANAPDGAVQLRVTASIAGDTNASNNIKVVDYEPNLIITDFGFNSSDGEAGAVFGHYRIEGADLRSRTTIGLYWSADRKFSGDDSPAFSFETRSNETPPGEAYEFPTIHGDEIAPPSEHQKYLIAVIDPLNAIAECDEQDNERPDELVPRIFTDLQADEQLVLRGEHYIVKYVVRNDSPVQLNVNITRMWESDTVMLNEPEVSEQIEVLLKPGESSEWTEQYPYSHEWDWVTPQIPIYQPDLWEKGLLGVLKGAVSLFPFGKIINGVSDALNHIAVTRNSILNIQSNPFADVVHRLIAEPVMASAPEFVTEDGVQAYVGQEKESALAKFKETALEVADILFAVSFTPIGIFAPDWMDVVEDDWRAVYDPPDPAYTTFATVDLPNPDLTSIPAGPLRHSALQYANGVALQEAIFRAIDKKDGAATFGDDTWRAQQLSHLAVLLNQQTLHRVEASNHAAYLAPWNEAQLPTPEDLVNYWQTHGLPTEVLDSLQRNGAPAGFADELLGVMRSLTTDDFAGLSPEVEPQRLRYEALASAGQALAFLESAIDIRVNVLGLETRSLDPSEIQLLQNYRSVIQARQDADDYGGDYLEIVSAFASDVMRLAILTNNYPAIVDDLNTAYIAAVNAAGNVGSTEDLRTAVIDLNNRGEVSASLKSELDGNIASIESAISAGDWAGVGPHLDALHLALTTAPAADISPGARQRLLNSVDSMIAIGTEIPGFTSPSLAGLPSQLTLTDQRSSVTGSGVTLTSETATFVGGRLELTFSNPRNDSQWIFADVPAFTVVTSDELSIDGRPVAQVVNAQPGILQLELLAAATTDRVQRLLNALQIDLPGSNQTWTSALDIVLRNGVGGTESASLQLTQPSSTPPTSGNHAPTDISLTNSSVPENRLPGTVVGTFVAVDQDAGDSFTYSFEVGTGSTDNGRFTIVGNQLRTAQNFNFETQADYTIRVRVSDSNGATFSKQLTVAILNAPDAPHAISLSSNTVVENQGGGAFVGLLTAEDEDGAAGPFTYSFVESPGSEDNTQFFLDGNALSTIFDFNFETQSQYALLVRATDATGRFSDHRVYVGVGDVNEPPLGVVPSAFEFPENVDIGTTVATLDTLDEDFGQSFTYQLVSGAGDDDNAFFVVVRDELRTARRFDLESKSQHSIRVRTKDPAGLTAETAIVFSLIDVNDAPTEVVLSPSAVAARLPGGVTVGTLTAVDADSDSFSFALVDGLGSHDNHRFEIVGNQLKALQSFELGPDSHYFIRVQVTDSEGAVIERELQIDVSPDPTILDTDLVSKSAGIVAASGSLGAYSQAISDDGRYIVFESSDNLVTTAESYGYTQIYLKDNVTGEVTLVSRNDADGAGGQGHSYQSQISANGMSIAYVSDAADLLDGVTITTTSLYVYDVATGITTLASHRYDDLFTGLDASVDEFRLSANGTKVVFSTYATDVVSSVTDDNSASDLYVYDIATQANTLVTRSNNSPTNTANGFVVEFAISGDGTKVVYTSDGTDIVPGVNDENGFTDIFLYNTVTNSNSLVSRTQTDATMSGDGSSFSPSISFDGTLIAYTSDSSDIVPIENNFQSNIFIYRANSSTNALVSHAFDSSIDSADFSSWNPQISSDGTTIVYESWASNLLAGYSGSTIQIYAYSVASSSNTLISHADGNVTLGADDVSTEPKVSSDGRLIVYRSRATDLKTGLVNPDAAYALFAYDSSSGLTKLVTHEPGNPLTVPVNVSSEVISIAGNGLTAVLSSFALLDGSVHYGSGLGQVFRYTFGDNTNTLLTAYPVSMTAGGDSAFSDMSADGRYLVFESDAPNLAPGQINTIPGPNIFYLDRLTGAVTLVSHADGLNQTTAYGYSTNARISADGTKITYEFLSFDTSQTDVIIFDRVTGVNTVVSHVPGSALPANSDSHAPRISDDGKRIVFESYATDLVSGVTDTLGNKDLFLYDVVTGAVTLVTHRFNSTTLPANEYSYSGEISGDGAKVVFTSYASDLVSDSSNDTNNTLDVFLYDVATNTVSLVSHAKHSPLVASDSESISPSICGNGMCVVYETSSTNVVEGEFHGAGDIYLYDVATGANRLISHRFDDANVSIQESASQPKISADGTKVVFEARGSTVVQGFVEIGGYNNIYVYDVPSGVNQLVSHNNVSHLAEVNYNSFNASISGDGSTIVWMTWADDVLSYVRDWNSGNRDTFGFGDVYLYDVATGRNSLISRSLVPDETGNDESTTGDHWEAQGRSLSHHGNVLIFDSLATDIVEGDLNQNRDLFAVEVSKRLPPFVATLTQDTVPENQPAGTIVGQILSRDEDSSDPVALSFTHGAGSNDNSRFTIDAHGYLRTAIGLDHEEHGAYRIRVRATDSSGMWTDTQFVIHATDLNDAPVLSGFPSSIRYKENATPVVIGIDASIFDPDVSDTSFELGELIVAISENGHTDDRLQIQNQGSGAGEIGISGNRVDYQGSEIGTYSGGTASTPLKVTFTTSAATVEAVTALLRSITFHVLGESPSTLTRQLAVTISDGLGDISAPVSMAVRVTAINDAPTLNPALSPTLGTIPEDTTNPAGTLVTTLLANAVADPDANALKGIAIIAVSDAAQGTWQFSLNNGGSWQAVGTVSSSSALLLPANAQTKVRFVPVPNFHGTVSLTYRAWDQTVGEVAGADSITEVGGTSAYSAASDSAALVISPVNDAPVLNASLTPSLGTINEDTTNPSGTLVSTLLAGAVTDVDAGALTGIAIIAASNSGHGVWQFSVNNGASWQLLGTATPSAARLLPADNLTRVRYIPNANFHGSVVLTYRAWDRTVGSAGGTTAVTAAGGATAFSSAFETAALTISAINDAPVLNADLPASLGTINEDTTDPAGTSVSSLLAGAVTDPDAGSLQGIAIVAASNSTQGTWQFTLNNGTTWQAMGTPTTSAARLLPADAATKVRFIPKTDFNGTAVITYRAWDRTIGTAGNTAAITGAGGATAFSVAYDTAAVTIQPVNDAPVINTALSPSLGSAAEDTTDIPGASIDSLVSAAITDADAGALKGIAVISVTHAAQGAWQFTLDNGTTWQAMGTPTSAAARLLPASAAAKIRFVPNANFHGTVTMAYRGWDQTTGTAGTTVAIGTPGGTSAFSAVYETAAFTVTPVNDAPTLNTALSPTLGTIAEDTTNPTGTTVESLLTGAVTDPDVGALKGIAVISASHTAQGTWQFTLNNGTTWQSMGTPTSAAARLLPADPATKVRFIPNANFYGTVALSYRAWDRTVGTAGGTSAIGATSGTSAFSPLYDSATLSVTPVNDAPTLNAALSPSLGSIAEDTTNPAGVTVKSLLTGAVTDPDAGALKGIAIISASHATQGTWQFSLDNGATWLALGTPTSSAARLLNDDLATKVRFVPNNNFHGTVALTYRAWDRTTGTSGDTVAIGVTGGATAYSAAFDSATLSVTPVNDAPVLDAALSPTLTTIDEDTTNPPGTLVSSLIAGAVTDPDAGALKGIAVIAASSTNQGTWQFTLNNGTTWQALGAPTPSTARLLPSDALTKIRFIPKLNFAGTVTLTYRAWDRSIGTSGSTASISAAGGTTAFSAAHEVASLTITPVNDAPVLNTALSPATQVIPKNSTNPPGQSVQSLLTGAVTDADVGALRGIAVIGASHATQGTWQFTLNNGATWQALGAVAANTARLLPADATTKVRFIPNPNFEGPITLVYRAWDGTEGSAGLLETIDITGGTSAFSVDAETVTFTVA